MVIMGRVGVGVYLGSRTAVSLLTLRQIQQELGDTAVPFQWRRPRQ